MKTLFLAFLLLLMELTPPTVLSEKDIKTTSFNKKNQGSKAPKKVFIRSFNAYFEVFEEASAQTFGSKKERADRTTFTSSTSKRMGFKSKGLMFRIFRS